MAATQLIVSFVDDDNDSGVQPDVVAISNPDVAQVIVHFVRQSGSYITSCFIPTAMLGLLAYSTFFIHIDDFNDRWRKSRKMCCWYTYTLKWWHSTTHEINDNDFDDTDLDDDVDVKQNADVDE